MIQSFPAFTDGINTFASIQDRMTRMPILFNQFALALKGCNIANNKIEDSHLRPQSPFEKTQGPFTHERITTNLYITGIAAMRLKSLIRPTCLSNVVNLVCLWIRQRIQIERSKFSGRHFDSKMKTRSIGSDCNCQAAKADKPGVSTNFRVFFLRPGTHYFNIKTIFPQGSFMDLTLLRIFGPCNTDKRKMA